MSEHEKKRDDFFFRVLRRGLDGKDTGSFSSLLWTYISLYLREILIFSVYLGLYWLAFFLVAVVYFYSMDSGQYPYFTYAGYFFIGVPPPRFLISLLPIAVAVLGVLFSVTFHVYCFLGGSISVWTLLNRWKKRWGYIIGGCLLATFVLGTAYHGLAHFLHNDNKLDEWSYLLNLLTISGGYVLVICLFVQFFPILLFEDKLFDEVVPETIIRSVSQLGRVVPVLLIPGLLLAAVQFMMVFTGAFGPGLLVLKFVFLSMSNVFVGLVSVTSYFAQGPRDFVYRDKMLR